MEFGAERLSDEERAMMKKHEEMHQRLRALEVAGQFLGQSATPEAVIAAARKFVDFVEDG